MARAFASASSQYLARASAILTAAPLTIAGWFNPTDTTARYLAGLFNNASGSNRIGLLWSGGTDSKLYAQIQASGVLTNVATTVTASTGAWHHVGLVKSGAAAHALYLDGGNKVTDATSSTPTGLDATEFGTLNNGGSRSNYFNGLEAEWGVWNVALSDLEFMILAAGISPLLVRPDALVFYAPLMGAYSPEIDLIGHRDLTVTGATAAVHPPISRYGGPRILKATGTTIVLGNMFLLF